MTRRATFKQRDTERAIRAAQAAGLKVIGVRPDGIIITARQDDPTPEWAAPAPQVAPKKRLVLL